MDNRRRRTRKITLCGILCAITLVGLFAACVVPSGRMGVTALAGLCTAVAVCAAGYTGGLACYGACGVLSLLLLPSKEIALYYCLCFGLYPVLKSKIESLNRLWLEWLLKLLTGNLMMLAVYQLLKQLLNVSLTFHGVGSWGLLLIGNGAFLCYDIAFTQVMGLVQSRLSAFRIG
jgi:hypothetical protein